MVEREHIVYLLRMKPLNEKWKVSWGHQINKNGALTITLNAIITILVQKNVASTRHNVLTAEMLLIAKQGIKGQDDTNGLENNTGDQEIIWKGIDQ
jgi:hypothetical protein